MYYHLWYYEPSNQRLKKPNSIIPWNPLGNGLQDQNPQMLKSLMYNGKLFAYNLHAWMSAKSLQLCPTLCKPFGLEPTRLLCSWDSPGKNTGVGCHFLLQGKSSQSRDLTHISCCLLPWQVDSLLLSHLGINSHLYTFPFPPGKPLLTT